MDRLPNELLHMILGYLDNDIWYNFRLTSVRTHGLPTERDIMKRVNGVVVDYKKLKRLENDLKACKYYLKIIFECCECKTYRVSNGDDLYLEDIVSEVCFSCEDRGIDVNEICNICIDKYYEKPILGVNCISCTGTDCDNDCQYVCPKCIVYYESHDFYCTYCYPHMRSTKSDS